MSKAAIGWNSKEISFFKKLSSPVKIQDFLDSIPYNSGTDTKSPRSVIEKMNAHCFEGALFAAACLRQLGFKPLIVDLRATNDDDHVIAVYQINKLWGAIAKSNFTMLRFREPVYKNIRELSMSYFDFYFNIIGQKTLHAYSLPFNLSRYDPKQWMTTTGDLEYIGNELDKKKHFPLLTSRAAKSLSDVRPYLIKAGLLGSVAKGLFKPKK
jgi:hypothetical protein